MPAKCSEDAAGRHEWKDPKFHPISDVADPLLSILRTAMEQHVEDIVCPVIIVRNEKYFEKQRHAFMVSSDGAPVACGSFDSLSFLQRKDRRNMNVRATTTDATDSSTPPSPGSTAASGAPLTAMVTDAAFIAAGAAGTVSDDKGYATVETKRHTEDSSGELPLDHGTQLSSSSTSQPSHFSARSTTAPQLSETEQYLANAVPYTEDALRGTTHDSCETTATTKIAQLNGQHCKQSNAQNATTFAVPSLSVPSHEDDAECDEVNQLELPPVITSTESHQAGRQDNNNDDMEEGDLNMDSNQLGHSDGSGGNFSTSTRTAAAACGFPIVYANAVALELLDYNHINEILGRDFGNAFRCYGSSKPSEPVSTPLTLSTSVSCVGSSSMANAAGCEVGHTGHSISTNNSSMPVSFLQIPPPPLDNTAPANLSEVISISELFIPAAERLLTLYSIVNGSYYGVFVYNVDHVILPCSKQAATSIAMPVPTSDAVILTTQHKPPSSLPGTPFLSRRTLHVNGQDTYTCTSARKQSTAGTGSDATKGSVKRPTLQLPSYVHSSSSYAPTSPGNPLHHLPKEHLQRQQQQHHHEQKELETERAYMLLFFLQRFKTAPTASPGQPSPVNSSVPISISSPLQPTVLNAIMDPERRTAIPTWDNTASTNATAATPTAVDQHCNVGSGDNKALPLLQPTALAPDQRHVHRDVASEWSGALLSSDVCINASSGGGPGTLEQTRCMSATRASQDCGRLTTGHLSISESDTARGLCSRASRKTDSGGNAVDGIWEDAHTADHVEEEEEAAVSDVASGVVFSGAANAERAVVSTVLDHTMNMRTGDGAQAWRSNSFSHSNPLSGSREEQRQRRVHLDRPKYIQRAPSHFDSSDTALERTSTSADPSTTNSLAMTYTPFSANLAKPTHIHEEGTSFGSPLCESSTNFGKKDVLMRAGSTGTVNMDISLSTKLGLSQPQRHRFSGSSTGCGGLSALDRMTQAIGSGQNGATANPTIAPGVLSSPSLGQLHNSNTALLAGGGAGGIHPSNGNQLHASFSQIGNMSFPAAQLNANRGHIVDTLNAANLRRRLRFIRGVRAVVMSPCVPETFAMNVAALMPFVQEIVKHQRTQHTHNGSYVFVNVDEKLTNIIVDVLPAAMLSAAAPPDAQSTETASGEVLNKVLHQLQEMHQLTEVNRITAIEGDTAATGLTGLGAPQHRQSIGAVTGYTGATVPTTATNATANSLGASQQLLQNAPGTVPELSVHPQSASLQNHSTLRYVSFANRNTMKTGVQGLYPSTLEEVEDYVPGESTGSGVEKFCPETPMPRFDASSSRTPQHTPQHRNRSASLTRSSMNTGLNGQKEESERSGTTATATGAASPPGLVDILPSTMKQYLVECDGTLCVFKEGDGCLQFPLITEERMTLLGEMDTVQLSTLKGIALFGVSVANLLTEEAANAAQAPPPEIIPLQYGDAAQDFLSILHTKNVVMKPSPSANASAFDTSLSPSTGASPLVLKDIMWQQQPSEKDKEDPVQQEQQQQQHVEEDHHSQDEEDHQPVSPTNDGSVGDLGANASTGKFSVTSKSDDLEKEEGDVSLSTCAGSCQRRSEFMNWPLVSSATILNSPQIPTQCATESEFQKIRTVDTMIASSTSVSIASGAASSSASLSFPVDAVNESAATPRANGHGTPSAAKVKGEVTLPEVLRSSTPAAEAPTVPEHPANPTRAPHNMYEIPSPPQPDLQLQPSSGLLPFTGPPSSAETVRRQSKTTATTTTTMNGKKTEAATPSAAAGATTSQLTPVLQARPGGGASIFNATPSTVSITASSKVTALFGGFQLPTTATAALSSYSTALRKSPREASLFQQASSSFDTSGESHRTCASSSSGGGGGQYPNQHGTSGTGTTSTNSGNHPPSSFFSHSNDSFTDSYNIFGGGGGGGVGGGGGSGAALVAETSALFSGEEAIEREVEGGGGSTGAVKRRPPIIFKRYFHLLICNPIPRPDIEEAVEKYGHCVTFITTPSKMTRYLTISATTFDVIIVEWSSEIVTPRVRELLSVLATEGNVIMYHITPHSPNLLSSNELPEEAIVRSEDIATMVTDRVVLDQARDYVRQKRLLHDMVEVRTHQTFQIVRQLGSGAFGDVFEVIMFASKGRLAMKRIFLKGMTVRQLEVINREVSIMSSLDHPNVITFSHTKMEENSYSIFMELGDGTLSERIHTPGVTVNWAQRDGFTRQGISIQQRGAVGTTNLASALMPAGSPLMYSTSVIGGVNAGPLDSDQDASITPAEAVLIIHDIAAGLAYLHSKGVIHRDIKPENILFCNGVAKLGDFGSAARVDEKQMLTNMKGTFMYMSPEVVIGEPYGKPCDIWSFGCVIADIVGLHLGHLTGLHLPAVVEMYKSIPLDSSMPLTTASACTAGLEHYHSVEKTRGVLQAVKLAAQIATAERSSSRTAQNSMACTSCAMDATLNANSFTASNTTNGGLTEVRVHVDPTAPPPALTRFTTANTSGNQNASPLVKGSKTLNGACSSPSSTTRNVNVTPTIIFHEHDSSQLSSPLHVRSPLSVPPSATASTQQGSGNVSGRRYADSLPPLVVRPVFSGNTSNPIQASSRTYANNNNNNTTISTHHLQATPHHCREQSECPSMLGDRSVLFIDSVKTSGIDTHVLYLPTLLVELFEGLLHRDPSKRMTIEEILDHPVTWDAEWMAEMMQAVKDLNTNKRHFKNVGNRRDTSMTLSCSSADNKRGGLGDGRLGSSGLLDLSMCSDT